MKQYKLCTIHEFAEYVAEIIDAQGKYENGQFNAPLPDYDFAIADKDREGKTLEEISLSSGGWYGMKQFDAGFDSIDLCLITDYYGGGSATITQIYGEQDKENTAKDIEDMIISSFNICEIVDKETVLIIEFEEVNGMKIETRKEIKEVLTNFYIADDGTEFESKYECETYEYDLKTKQLNERITKLEIKKLNDIPPLDTEAQCIQDNHNFRWFKVNNKNDIDLIGAMYGDGVVEPKQYPDVICVEIEEDTNYCESWSLCLSEMKQETIEFWEHFGLKVNFEEEEK